jgi:putative FmdB family regulatory protein
MPLYEFRCGQCGQRFEVLRPMAKADDPAPCPQCQSADTKRAISRFASFSKSADGSTAAVAGGGGCAGCSASSCAGCKH